MLFMFNNILLQQGSTLLSEHIKPRNKADMTTETCFNIHMHHTQWFLNCGLDWLSMKKECWRPWYQPKNIHRLIPQFNITWLSQISSGNIVVATLVSHMAEVVIKNDNIQPIKLSCLRFLTLNSWVGSRQSYKYHNHGEAKGPSASSCSFWLIFGIEFSRLYFSLLPFLIGTLATSNSHSQDPLGSKQTLNMLSFDGENQVELVIRDEGHPVLLVHASSPTYQRNASGPQLASKGLENCSLFLSASSVVVLQMSAQIFWTGPLKLSRAPKRSCLSILSDSSSANA